MWHHSQTFQQHTLQLSYKKNKEVFFNSVKKVSRNSISSNANVISSHVLYKVNVKSDGLFSSKVRIASHGNEDSIKLELRFESCMCYSIGIRAVLSVSA